MLSEQQYLTLQGNTFRGRLWPELQSQAGGRMHQTFSFPAPSLKVSWEAAPHFPAKSGLRSFYKAQIRSFSGV